MKPISLVDALPSRLRTAGTARRAWWRAATATVAFAALASAPHQALAIPSPIHEWTFDDGTALDVVGNLNGTLNGDATIANGQLVLDGSHANGGAYMSTAFDTVSLSTMTLVSWVSLGTLAQGGGSALSVVDASQAFNSIDYAEATPNQWIAGSDYFNRTQPNNGGAAVSDTGEHMLAITYNAGGTVELYLDGAFYANGGTYSPFTLADPQYMVGLRHPASETGNGLLTGSIDMASVYASALSAGDVATLYSEGAGSSPIPEPASAAVVAAAFGLLCLSRRRRA